MTASIIAFSALFLLLLYVLYQQIRNQLIFNIRRNWIHTDDNRWYKYSYDFMFEPSKNNWYGLRYPKDKHYE